MSNRITVLNNKLINKIAAGEVINRPSSILKELIENSIDAKAKNIDIHIYKDKIDTFHISDDGIGINAEDLNRVFKRHATSKISNEQDLNNISSLGFRGEALSSIGAISEVKLKTARYNDKGSIIHFRYGDMLLQEPVTHEKGTLISIKNIFNNVPARKKFLKSKKAEHSHNNLIIDRMLIGNPNHNFRLYIDDKLKKDYPSSDLLSRIKEVYNLKDSDNLININISNDICSISGYIGDFDFSGPSKLKQYLFVNNRYVTDPGINKIIRSCYLDGIRPVHHPFFIIFINVPINTLDVNIHPSKEEVKFENYSDIKFHIKDLVRRSLGASLSKIPSKIEYPKSNSNINNEQLFNNALFSDTFSAPFIDGANDVNDTKFNKFVINSKPEFIENNDIWQIHNKYLVTEIKTGLLVIDQHVAHERILYEKTIDGIEGSGLPSQSLLFPKTIEINKSQFSVLEDILFYLEKIGFSIRKFGENTIIVDGAPSELKWGNEETIIKELLNLKIKNKDVRSSVVDYIAASYSCHTAIKAGDRLDHFEMKNLIDKLFATKQPYYCPHGRPITFNLSVNELDQKFERI